MNKKRISKKGLGVTDSLMYIYRFIVIIIAMFAFVTFVNMLIQPFPDVSEAKAELLVGRIIYSEALHYVDIEGNLNPLIIDVDKLDSKEKDLEKYFREEFYHPKRTNLLVFKLELEYNNTHKGTEKNYTSNSTQFTLMYPLSTFEGKGSVVGIERNYATRCNVNNKIIFCDANLIVLMPRS